MIRIGKQGISSFWTLLFVLLIALPARAAVNVQAYVDRDEVGVGDTFVVTVSISGTGNDSFDANEPRVPQLDGFELMNSWSSSSTSSKLVQGPQGMQFETIRRQDFNYMLSPTREGQLQIPAFEVVVDGKTHFTKPIKMTISKQGSGSAKVPPGMPGLDEMDEAEQMFNQLLQRRGLVPPPSSAYKNLPKNPNEAFFIQAEIDKTEAYEGEEVVVNWYILTRGALTSLDRLKFPDLKGFWKEIIEEVPALNFTQEIINGVAYKKALLASHALFPIKAGTAVIDEYKVKATVALPSNPFSQFGFGRPYTYTRSSERIKVNVKPLPTEGRPSDFAGAVGKFDIQATVEGNQFPANQPFNFKIRFEGRGNAKLIELPNLELPGGVELYDTKSESKFFKNGQSYKEFNVLLIPREQGELTLPSISFSMFDPQTKRYVTKKTEPVKVRVTPGANGSASANRVQTPSAGNSGSAVKPAELPDVVVSYEASHQRMGVAFWGLLYLGVFAALGFKGWQELGRDEKKQNVKEGLTKRLKKADKLIEQSQWRESAIEMANTIYYVLGEMTGKGASAEIARLLDMVPPSVRREVGEEVTKLVERLQVIGFAPESLVGSLKEKENLRQLSKDIDRVLRKAIALTETVGETGSHH